MQNNKKCLCDKNFKTISRNGATTTKSNNKHQRRSNTFCECFIEVKRIILMQWSNDWLFNHFSVTKLEHYCASYRLKSGKILSIHCLGLLKAYKILTSSGAACIQHLVWQRLCKLISLCTQKYTFPAIQILLMNWGCSTGSSTEMVCNVQFAPLV